MPITLILANKAPAFFQISHFDASHSDFPILFSSEINSLLGDSSPSPSASNTIIVTSPPYDRSLLPSILTNALAMADLVAMKLPINFLDPGRGTNFQFLRLGCGLARVMIMSRHVAGGEEGPRRERYTEAWFLWDKADSVSLGPIASFHAQTQACVGPSPSLTMCSSVFCAWTPSLGSADYMLPTHVAATTTILNFLQPILILDLQLVTFTHETSIFK